MRGSFVYVLLAMAGVEAGKQTQCYQPVFVKTSWTDRRPEFAVNMTFSPTGVLASTTQVNEEVPEPITKIALLQRDGPDAIETTLYNVTVKLCKLVGMLKKTQMFAIISQQSQKASNYSYTCPMRKGVYVMDNLRIGKTNPLLGFMYGPKRTFTFTGGLYSNLGNGTLLPLSTYYVRMKIVKKSCRD